MNNSNPDNPQRSTPNASACAFATGIADAVRQARIELESTEKSVMKIEAIGDHVQQSLEEMRLMAAQRRAVLAPLEAILSTYRRCP